MRDAVQKGQRCPAVKKDGSPCRGVATTSGYCVGHRPGADEARRLGGAGTSRAARAVKLLPARLQPILERLERALVQVHEGELSPGRAQAMSGLAGAIVRIYQAGEMEERLRSLEQRVKEGEAEQ